MNWLKNLAGTVGALSPTCKQAARLQSEAMDRRLSFSEKTGLRLHLLLCKWCRRYGEHLKFLRSAARQCEEHQGHQASEGLSPEARRRIEQRIRSEGQ
jgi:hypothetical protein